MIKHMWAMANHDGPMFYTLSDSADGAIASVSDRLGGEDYEGMQRIGMSLERVRVEVTLLACRDALRVVASGS